jgi:hypothetical protein
MAEVIFKLSMLNKPPLKQKLCPSYINTFKLEEGFYVLNGNELNFKALITDTMLSSREE